MPGRWRLHGFLRRTRVLEFVLDKLRAPQRATVFPCVWRWPPPVTEWGAAHPQKDLLKGPSENFGGDASWPQPPSWPQEGDSDRTRRCLARGVSSQHRLSWAMHKWTQPTPPRRRIRGSLNTWQNCRSHRASVSPPESHHSSNVELRVSSTWGKASYFPLRSRCHFKAAACHPDFNTPAELGGNSSIIRIK